MKAIWVTLSFNYFTDSSCLYATDENTELKGKNSSDKGRSSIHRSMLAAWVTPGHPSHILSPLACVGPVWNLGIIWRTRLVDPGGHWEWERFWHSLRNQDKYDDVWQLLLFVCICVWGLLTQTKVISAYLSAEYEITQRWCFIFVKFEMEVTQQRWKTSLECPPMSSELNIWVWDFSSPKLDFPHRCHAVVSEHTCPCPIISFSSTPQTFQGCVGRADFLGGSTSSVVPDPGFIKGLKQNL